MAAALRESPPDLIAELAKTPGRFDFFQAVRLLLRQSLDVTGQREDALNIGVQPTLNYSASALSRFVPKHGETPPELTVTFAGLYGPQGVLPQHYTALIMGRVRQKDTTLRDFLNLFHQRIFLLLHEAWEYGHLPIAVERDTRAELPDDGSRIFWSLAGLGFPSQKERSAYADDALIYFSGLFARQPRTAIGLETILGSYFGWPVEVEQFHGRWLYLDTENRAQLPLSGMGMLGAQLGVNAVPGRRVWDSQGKLRLRVGPVNESVFRTLLPHGSAHDAFADLARTYTGLEFDIDLQILLEPDAVPWSQLQHAEASRPQLGRTAWVRSHNFGKPIADAVFEFS